MGLFRQFIEAAEDERYAFKAVFTAGGPGSGKTSISERMFPTFLKANSDQIQVLSSKKTGIPVAATPENPRYPEFLQQMQRAQEMNKTRAMYWASQGYPIVIDTTGRSMPQIETINNSLRELGYDTGMVFVNTTLEQAILRNRIRQRNGGHGAEENYLRTAWESAQANIRKFQGIVGVKFVIVDNDEDYSVRNFIGQHLKMLSAAANKILGRPFTKEQISQKIRQNRK